MCKIFLSESSAVSDFARSSDNGPAIWKWLVAEVYKG